ncbi:integrase catalytic domain-containing protein [Trichonephila clavata]|uniref:Integrase catalytic domain-containing protein n=1 Tax=Trichonephila clavata TaxID=2740835 RepID=A0A8X6GV52_TRICU|nr:integrase catalytic domain-containing protein [Trichonephila clavata]
MDNREKFPVAAEILETDFYDDDLVSGVSNIESGKEAQKQLIELLSCVGMKLHKWSSNYKDMLKELPYEAQEYHFDRDEEKVKTLGLIWNRSTILSNFPVSRNAKNPHSKRTGPLTSEDLTELLSNV